MSNQEVHWLPCPIHGCGFRGDSRSRVLGHLHRSKHSFTDQDIEDIKSGDFLPGWYANATQWRYKNGSQHMSQSTWYAPHESCGGGAAMEVMQAPPPILESAPPQLGLIDQIGVDWAAEAQALAQAALDLMDIDQDVQVQSQPKSHPQQPRLHSHPPHTSTHSRVDAINQSGVNQAAQDQLQTQVYPGQSHAQTHSQNAEKFPDITVPVQRQVDNSSYPRPPIDRRRSLNPVVPTRDEVIEDFMAMSAASQRRLLYCMINAHSYDQDPAERERLLGMLKSQSGSTLPTGSQSQASYLSLFGLLQEQQQQPRPDYQGAFNPGSGLPSADPRFLPAQANTIPFQSMQPHTAIPSNHMNLYSNSSHPQSWPQARISIYERLKRLQEQELTNPNPNPNPSPNPSPNLDLDPKPKPTPSVPYYDPDERARHNGFCVGLRGESFSNISI